MSDLLYRHRARVRAFAVVFRVVICLVTVATLGFGGDVSSAIAEPSNEPFAIVPGSFGVTPSNYAAGAHADLTIKLNFANSEEKTHNDVRTTVVNLPAGFMGNNTAVPTCTVAQLLAKPPAAVGTQCPVASQVGTISLELTIKTKPIDITVPVYNLEVTSFGITAELGFKSVALTQILDVTVRPGDSGLTGTARDTVEAAEAHNVVLTLWGVPASHEHDPERGRVCEEFGETNEVECVQGNEEAKIAVKPYLANPTSCGMFTASMQADSWEEPFVEPVKASAEVGPIVECDRVHFDPSLTVKPTTNAAESPSGLDVSLEVPQTWERPESLATSTLKDTRVALPVGYTVNPSAGSGLAGCTPAQYEAETASSAPGAGCPPESKLGKVDIETPVLAEKIEGDVFLAQPLDNPFNALIALYVVAKAPARGIIIKTAGEVVPDPVTGQLVSFFPNTPQQPFSKFTLELTQGQTSPLVSPPACGVYTAQAELTPWSAPSEPSPASDPLQIERGIGGGACPAGGVPPFKPTVIAGTQGNAAGSYSPFYLRITRNDGEQELTKFTTVLPPGLSGNLTGIPFCPEAAIEAARSATGLHEIAEPSCPAASEIGHSLVGAGVGSVLAWTPGKIYLAGPYHGSALSIVSVTSAAVGPFDLGTVVIRFGLQLNPDTAQVEIDSEGSDAIPHIIDGIVVHVREIHVYVDRSRFVLNPTNCNPMSISETITGAGADPANPTDQDNVAVGTPFQAADCANLSFKPTLTAFTSGKTSRKGGASLVVKVSYPNAPQGTQANIRSVKVDLPKQLPSRLSTLQKACPDTIFDANPAMCPSGSIVGHAKAVTPILPVPLEGPAYFVSHGGAKFPELIMVIQGYGLTIDLHGETFISKKGITSSTFRAVPDQPVTSFELTLPEGADSALAANGNLCKTKLAMPTALTGQNGIAIHNSTKIAVTDCPKVAKGSSKQARAKRHGAKKS